MGLGVSGATAQLVAARLRCLPLGSPGSPRVMPDRSIGLRIPQDLLPSVLTSQWVMGANPDRARPDISTDPRSTIWMRVRKSGTRRHHRGTHAHKGNGVARI